MDYEKKYKEALKKARAQYQKCIDGENNIQAERYADIFPELRDSEDERMMKALIGGLKSYLDVYSEWHDGVCIKEIIAWLEKQGEHHIACSEEQMKVLDEVLNFAANHESPYWNDYIFETLNNLIRQLKV